MLAVVLELFCGTARFARAMESHRPVMRWDILFGDNYDLRSRANQELVLGWLRAGWLAAVWLGTPCQSFSRARNQPGGPPALRNKSHVHGLPGLRPCDQAAVDIGNIMARFSSSFASGSPTLDTCGDGESGLVLDLADSLDDHSISAA